MIRGDRYLDEHNAELARLIIDILPYCDLPAAMQIHAGVVNAPRCRPKDLALLACNDRFFLLTVLLRRSDLLHPWLYDRCREVEADPDGYLDLWAREHYKSTIITFAGTIQDALVDPDLTTAIFSHTKDLARKFVSPIKQEFETNQPLKSAFPDVLWDNPRREAPRWGNDGLIIKRKSNPKESTIEGWGLIDGMPTGGHYGKLVYDDIITRKSVTNPDMVRKATENWELSDNLGAGDVRKQHIGTRYSFGDTWGQLLERKILKPRIYPATEDGTPTGRPVLISQKRWAEKLKTQRSTLNAQMLQNPLAGAEQIFRPEWFEHRWEVRPSPLNVYIMVDPSGGRKRDSDRTAIAVVAVDRGGSKYLIDGMCHRMTLTERWNNLRNTRRRWLRASGVNMVKVGYERYGMQADIEHFETQMQETGEAFEIIELQWPREGDHSKRDRIERLEPDLRSGRFLFPALMSVRGQGECYWHMATAENSQNGMKNQIVTIEMKGPTKKMAAAALAGRTEFVVRGLRRRDEDGEQYDVTRSLIDELLYFPFAPHDDMADAVSRIYDMNPVAPSIDEQREADSINELVFPDS